MKKLSHILFLNLLIFLLHEVLVNVNAVAIPPSSLLQSAIQGKIQNGKTYNEPKKAAWSFIEKYCPDGYYLLQQYYNAPSQFNISGIKISLGEHLDYGAYIPGNSEKDIIRSLSTIVHEVCHGYASRLAWKALQDQNIVFSFDDGFSYYYLGDQRSILVKETPVFKSREINRIFPENIRTHRYEIYIYPSDPMMGTQQKGIYGLLDELTAYYHGTRVSVELYDYYRTISSESGSEWLVFLEGVGSTIFAHKEFKLFIMQYLIYAEQYQPDIYRELLENHPFVTAFLIVDEKFNDLIQRFLDLKNEIIQLLRQREIEVIEEDDFLFIGTEGRKMFHQDFEKLRNELTKEPYVRLMARLEERYK